MADGSLQPPHRAVNESIPPSPQSPADLLRSVRLSIYAALITEAVGASTQDAASLGAVPRKHFLGMHHDVYAALHDGIDDLAHAEDAEDFRGLGQDMVAVFHAANVDEQQQLIDSIGTQLAQLAATTPEISTLCLDTADKFDVLIRYHLRSVDPTAGLAQDGR